MIRGIIKGVEGNKGSGLLLITVEQENGDQQRLAAEGGMLARALGECFGTEYTGKEIYYTENQGLLESFEPVVEPDPPGGYSFDKETGTGSWEDIDGWE